MWVTLAHLPALERTGLDCTDAINGCETDINESLLHCGGCDQPCASGQTCHEGACI